MNDSDVRAIDFYLDFAGIADILSELGKIC